MTGQLTGKRVLVIGGSSGIGFGAAEAAVRSGAAVTIASRNEDRLNEAASKLGHGVEVHVVDTGQYETIVSLFEKIEAVDHVIVSSSAAKPGSVRKMNLDDAYASMDSKFWGAYRVAKAARISENGSLTLISGFLSQRPNALSVLQGAINAAIEALVRGLALELAPIRVNAVSPGLVDTPLLASMSDEMRRAMLQNAQENLPVKKYGVPADIAQAILFVATNPYTTGSVVTVDGGATISPFNVLSRPTPR